MTTEENKLEILRKVENGTLTIEEGADLIGMLEKAKSEPEVAQPENAQQADSQGSTKAQPKREPSGCWKAFWSMFLVGGALLSSFSAYWLYQGFHNHGLSWGFWLSWIPMIIGIALMIFGWALMDSPWMHVKLHSTEHEKKFDFIFSMPVPFNLARWVFENFGHYMPEEVKSQEILEVISQAEASIKKGDPFQIQVDDDKDGSKVDIYIN